MLVLHRYLLGLVSMQLHISTFLFLSLSKNPFNWNQTLRNLKMIAFWRFSFHKATLQYFYYILPYSLEFKYCVCPSPSITISDKKYECPTLLKMALLCIVHSDRVYWLIAFCNMSFNLHSERNNKNSNTILNNYYV